MFAENVEEARLLVIGGKGYMPVEGGGGMPLGNALTHVHLLRGGKPINRNYCVFWKLDDETEHLREFGKILENQFHHDE